MSDTPRTDAVAYDAVGYQHEDGCIVHSHFARGLERELNSSNARIAALETYVGRLEKAGDALNEGIGCGCGGEYGMCKSCEDRDLAWESAKESKP